MTKGIKSLSQIRVQDWTFDALPEDNLMVMPREIMTSWFECEGQNGGVTQIILRAPCQNRDDAREVILNFDHHLP